MALTWHIRISSPYAGDDEGRRVRDESGRSLEVLGPRCGFLVLEGKRGSLEIVLTEEQAEAAIDVM